MPPCFVTLARLRRAQFLLAALALSGCAVFDPTPYDPLAAGDANLAMPAAAPDWGHFSLMETDLRQMAAAYARQRNTLMRQNVFFDLGLLGLTGAAVINPVFHGAQAATIGLGFAAGGVAATRVYFAPQNRVTLYNSAAGSLTCAAGVAGQMSGLYDSSEGRLQSLRTTLQRDLGDAGTLLISGTATGDAGTKLLAARDAAVAVLARVQQALGALDGGAERLRLYGMQVVGSTSKNVVAGTQNLDAALAKINALTPSAAKSGPAAVSATLQLGAGPARHMVVPTLDVATVTAALGQDTLLAGPLADPVNTVWATLAQCS